MAVPVAGPERPNLPSAKIFFKKGLHRRAGLDILLLAQNAHPKLRAFSSGGERFPDTEEVTSSNLVTPTIKPKGHRLGGGLFWCPDTKRTSNLDTKTYGELCLTCPERVSPVFISASQIMFLLANRYQRFRQMGLRGRAAGLAGPTVRGMAAFCGFKRPFRIGVSGGSFRAARVARRVRGVRYQSAKSAMSL